MTKWIDKSDPKQKLDVIDIYANANIVPKLSETQKETFLIKQINIESLISQLSEELLDKLLEQDKLIYNAKIIVTVEKQSNLKNFLKKYLDKYETEENLDEIYLDKSIDFIIIGIKLNKYVDQIINFFDKAVENGKDLPDKIDEKVLKVIIDKTSDSETIERIMDLDSKNFTHIIRTMIIRRIFRSFPKKFTKAQISDFVFGDSNFIDKWEIDGQHKILPEEEIENNRKGIKLLIETAESVSDCEYMRKGSKKIILKKSFNSLFKEE